MTSRQKGLYLVARLYELAAEFSDQELQEISNDQSRQPASPAIKHAIDALIQLHREVESIEPPEAVKNSKSSSGKVISPTAEASSLADLLGDRNSFPTVADIANALEIPARSKESRERYIARVSRLVGAMDSRGRKLLLRRVADGMDSKPGSFISSWSRLIKEM
ncbi:hypothetical protein QTI24_01410 [Variovorax sp. J22P240]|uniref:hypothetical protein n=1 Tax=Variovorax sp. J22P240 TaxID=3053514 RepID=UPI0025789C38|nr:hypothetical protein [Variovorax sp. J22P240]MDL9997239.1 hypothetical protein [Variovorax sp. J22P240]